MTDNTQTYKKTFLLGLIAYLLLSVFSIAYYKERTIFTDIAYHMFFIIKTNGFAIQNFRYIAYFSQVFPLLAQRLHFSLGTVLHFYSSGFIVYYFACYLLCGFWIKDYRLAITLLLCNVLFVAHTFFWIQSELPQALIFLFLLVAIALRSPAGKLFTFISIPLVLAGIFVIALSHPLLIFPVFYLLAFLFLSDTTRRQKKSLTFFGISYVIMLLIKHYYFKTEYETAAMQNWKHIYKVDYLHLYSNQVFLYNCTHKYFWIPLLFISAVVIYIFLKRWLKLLLLVATCAIYITIINAAYPGSDTSLAYMENMYLPIALFIGLPFVYDIMPQLQTRKLANIALLAFTATCAVNIKLTSKTYIARLNWERSFLEQHTDKKLVVDARQTPRDVLIMNWATPYEFWLLSTVEKHKTASLVITDDTAQFKGRLNVKNVFVGPW